MFPLPRAVSLRSWKTFEGHTPEPVGGDAGGSAGSEWRPNIYIHRPEDHWRGLVEYVSREGEGLIGDKSSLIDDGGNGDGSLLKGKEWIPPRVFVDHEYGARPRHSIAKETSGRRGVSDGAECATVVCGEVAAQQVASATVVAINGSGEFANKTGGALRSSTNKVNVLTGTPAGAETPKHVETVLYSVLDTLQKVREARLMAQTVNLEKT